MPPRYAPGSYTSVCVLPDRRWAWVRSAPSGDIVCECEGGDGWSTPMPGGVAIDLDCCGLSGEVVCLAKGADDHLYRVTRAGHASLGPVVGNQCCAFDPITGDEYAMVDGCHYTRNGEVIAVPFAEGTSQGIRFVHRGVVAFGDDWFVRERAGQRFAQPVERDGILIGQLVDDTDRIAGYTGSALFLAIGDGGHCYEPKLAISAGRVAIAARTERGCALLICPPWPVFSNPTTPTSIPTSTPEPTPVSEPVPVPNLRDLPIARWTFRGMEGRQLEAFAEGGKPAILRLQMHWFADLTPIVQAALPGWQVKWERYRNPVPGTEWFWLPDQFLLIDPNGFVHSVKVIIGASEAYHRDHGAFELDEQGERRYRWVLGEPGWMDLGVNGHVSGRLENVTVDAPLADPQPDALGQSPFDAPEPAPAPVPAPQPVPTTPMPAPSDPSLAALLLKIIEQQEAIVSELVALRAAQGEQTAALKTSIAELQKQVRDGVKIRF